MEATPRPHLLRPSARRGGDGGQRHFAPLRVRTAVRHAGKATGHRLIPRNESVQFPVPA
jgi:hypothetical protein